MLLKGIGLWYNVNEKMTVIFAITKFELLKYIDFSVVIQNMSQKKKKIPSHV